jgi:predicted dehydrogenase
VTLEHHTADGVETIRFAPLHQITNQLRHLCDCLGTGQPHRIPPENSIAQMRVIDAVFESIATGQAVEMAW